MAKVETSEPNQINVRSDDGRLIATIYTDADNSSLLTLGGIWGNATALWDNRKSNETVLATRKERLRIVNEENDKTIAVLTPTKAELGGVDLLQEINSLRAQVNAQVQQINSLNAQVANLASQLRNKADVNHRHGG